ncbi:MAG: hypothetical protein M1819_005967 [Sarea resinae]|nr:MAG: hypothetical protein M1819_005967 [Sarea resinae]
MSDSTSTTLRSIEGGRNSDEVRVVSVNEYKQAAQCLAEAFADDEVAGYFINTPATEHWSSKRKWNLHVSILQYIVAAHCLKGLVTTIGPNYDCVALWMPPGKNMDDILTLFRSGLWRLRYKLCAEGKKRFFTEFMPLLHDTKTNVLGDRDEDSYYLVYVGTKPTSRGKGYARKLIEHVTKQADVEGRACYLESSNAMNPPIYRKLGFEVKQKIFLSRGLRSVELDIMVREPANPRSLKSASDLDVLKKRSNEIENAAEVSA